MKNLIHFLFRFSFFILVLLAISCKKDSSIDVKNEELYSVNFKFSGFNTRVSPLWSKNNGRLKLADSRGNTQNYAEGYLYFWSFNQDNLIPDIRYNNLFIPTISYGNDDVPSSFVNSTYAYENFVAGRALTFTGNKDILIKMPIKEVIQVTGLGFDVGSSGMGPKDFEIYYSTDKGIVYEILALNNQFGNISSSNQKNTYTYDLSVNNIQSEELWIKIKPKSGERVVGSIFNESAGVLRMDNLRLNGIAQSMSSTNTVDNIHYYLFDKNKPDVVISGVKELNASNSLDISIPVGDYHVCFFSNTSNAELLIPIKPTLETIYVGNNFSNFNADIFGYIGELIVNQNQTTQIELERLFSQVKVEFTDAFGLEQITKIVIDQLHDPFFFAPYNTAMINPILDQSSIEIMADFSTNKQLVFNQFLGKPTEVVPINYSVSVYGPTGILRTLNLGSSLKNNMQLVFRGNIIDGIDQNNTFNIHKNENWDGNQITEF